ncbi:hypothetical protein K470DRAFT_219546 [Piedraia hortae CBS 480.64]|uniref:GST N-terminal domain-containing protein n=1 Tax=Piedraia hortae CBS 480.64 TaxID=1314780 RepID=A0A6A7BW50_9PEZI|nr:hypothetical protein K470DRAFT_219546 [Piedraia hortae CBS 480.64]
MSTSQSTNILNWVNPNDKTGEFKRQQSVFRDWVSNEPGAKYPAEEGRYHLYVSYACPWAHRALIVRSLKGLEKILPFTSVHWHLESGGWRFATPSDGEVYSPSLNVTEDPNHDKTFTHLSQLYFESSPEYTGRYTVPVLYDKIQKRIVNNESSEIIAMLNSAFNSLVDRETYNLNLRPASLEEDIDTTNAWLYDAINNGVYKAGFATTQEAYTTNVTSLFTALETVETHLREAGPYYFGKELTETDIRLFTTLIRFDPVYVQHFKCNLKDVRSGFPAIHRWLRGLYWGNEAFKKTTVFEHIKLHYTKSHRQINPFGITPAGPERDILPLGVEVDAVEAVKGEKEV